MIERLVKKIALIQTSMVADQQANKDHFAELIAKTMAQHVDIICLPELFTSQYFAQTEDQSLFSIAEPIPGPTTSFLQEQAKKHQVTIIGGSIYEKGEGDHLYNTALIIDESGQIQLKYRKMHIPQDPHYYERFYFTPGNLGYKSYAKEGLKIAPLICYDQWFPEPARILALRGVHLICYPTAIGWIAQMKNEEPFSRKRWEDVMCAHASMNGVYVAACNRVGTEKEINFWGNSFIADPFGQVIARASSTEEEILIGTIDTENILNSQEGWGFLQHRRPESYEELMRK